MGFLKEIVQLLYLLVRTCLWIIKNIVIFIVVIFVVINIWSVGSVYAGFYRTGFIHQKIYDKLSATDENRLLQYRFNKPLLSKMATWHCHIDMYALPNDLTTNKLSEIATPFNKEGAEYPPRCLDAPIWGLQEPPYKEKWLFFNLNYVGNESGHKHWDILVKGDTKNAPLSRSVSDEIWQINDDKRQFVMIDKNTNTVRVIESYWDCDISVLLCN